MNAESPNNSSDAPRGAASGRNGPSITLIALGIVVVLFVVFFLQNNEAVPIDFLFFEHTTTIRWSLMVALVLGILLDRILLMWWRRRRGRTD